MPVRRYRVEARPEEEMGVELSHGEATSVCVSHLWVATKHWKPGDGGRLLQFYLYLITILIVR